LNGFSPGNGFSQELWSRKFLFITSQRLVYSHHFTAHFHQIAFIAKQFVLKQVFRLHNTPQRTSALFKNLSGGYCEKGVDSKGTGKESIHTKLWRAQ
jgi:hypothetical protein